MSIDTYIDCAVTVTIWWLYMVVRAVAVQELCATRLAFTALINGGMAPALDRGLLGRPSGLSLCAWSPGIWHLNWPA